MPPKPTRPPPESSLTDAPDATMPTASSTSGSTFPQWGGSDEKQLFTSTAVGCIYRLGALTVVGPPIGDGAAAFRSGQKWRTELPPGALPLDAPPSQTAVQGTTMSTALSPSGSRCRLQSGIQSDTLSTIMRDKPTRPPPGAPLPESLRVGLSQRDVLFVRRDLARNILQKRSTVWGVIQVMLLESFLEVSWQPDLYKKKLGRLWIGLRSKAFAVEGGAEVFCWPIHLTLFKADDVRCPTPELRAWTEQMSHNAVAQHWFIAAGPDFTELTRNGLAAGADFTELANNGCRVIVYLNVGSELHNRFKTIHQRVLRSVWVHKVSHATFTQYISVNFHLSLD